MSYNTDVSRVCSKYFEMKVLSRTMIAFLRYSEKLTFIMSAERELFFVLIAPKQPLSRVQSRDICTANDLVAHLKWQVFVIHSVGGNGVGQITSYMPDEGLPS